METYPKVLILEDDLIEIKKIQRAFKELKLEELAICKNGIEGTEFLADDNNLLPNVILLDLNMPKMNGLEFLSFLKNHNIYKRIPVVIFTTSSNITDIEYCFENNAAGYMVKPIDHGDYLNTLKVIESYWNTSKVII